jgi:hypothetical protein
MLNLVEWRMLATLLTAARPELFTPLGAIHDRGDLTMTHDGSNGGSGAPRRRGRLAGVALASVVSVAALVAAGCGGSSSNKSANEAYANSVCTAVGTWEEQVKSIATDFSGGISKATLQSKITQVQAATKTLTTEIKAVPAPNSSEGKAAKQQLDQLSTDITTTISSAKSAVDQLQGNASVATITAAVATLAPQVKDLATEATSAISTLKSAGGSLGSAFKNTSSCKSLG